MKANDNNLIAPLSTLSEGMQHYSSPSLEGAPEERSNTQSLSNGDFPADEIVGSVLLSVNLPDSGNSVHDSQSSEYQSALNKSLADGSTPSSLSSPLPALAVTPSSLGRNYAETRYATNNTPSTAFRSQFCLKG